MRVFTVHIRRHGLNIDRDIAIVKEGFSWSAFLFGPFWALWHRHWLVAVVLICVPAALTGMGHLGGLDSITRAICNGAWSVLVGMLANDIRRFYLERAHFLEVAIATGKTADEALSVYLTTSPLTPPQAASIAPPMASPITPPMAPPMARATARTGEFPR